MTSRYWRHRLHDSPYVLLPYSSALACKPLINKNESQYFYFHEQIQAWLLHVYLMHVQSHHASSKTRSQSELFPVRCALLTNTERSDGPYKMVIVISIQVFATRSRKTSKTLRIVSLCICRCFLRSYAEALYVMCMYVYTQRASMLYIYIQNENVSTLLFWRAAKIQILFVIRWYMSARLWREQSKGFCLVHIFCICLAGPYNGNIVLFFIMNNR